MQTRAIEAQWIESLEPMVRKLVSSLRRHPQYRQMDVEDMRQEALLVLLTRVREYQPGGRASLWTYARTRIIGHFRDQAETAARRHSLLAANRPELGPGDMLPR